MYVVDISSDLLLKLIFPILFAYSANFIPISFHLFCVAGTLMKHFWGGKLLWPESLTAADQVKNPKWRWGSAKYNPPQFPLGADCITG